MGGRGRLPGRASSRRVRSWTRHGACARRPLRAVLYLPPGGGEVEGVAPGSFARHLAFADHARSADILFSYRADDAVDPFGLVGRSWSPNWRVGLGGHGGLHAKEMSSVGILAGPLIRSGLVSQVPSDICDFAPTVLGLLGIARPSTMTGRVLAEVLTDGAEEEPRAIETVHETSDRGYLQQLRRVEVGAAVYLESAEAPSCGVRT